MCFSTSPFDGVRDKSDLDVLEDADDCGCLFEGMWKPGCGAVRSFIVLLTSERAADRPDQKALVDEDQI